MGTMRRTKHSVRSHALGRACLGLFSLLALSYVPARGIERLDAEETIADLLPSRFPAGASKDFAARHWAVLPQFGYGPDTSVMAGIKFAERNLVESGLSLDLDATYALNEQQSFAFSVGSPRLLDGRLLLLLRASYYSDPQREFFGLGNDSVDGPVSTHEFGNAEGGLSIGWRLFDRLSLNFEVSIRKVHIGRGDPDDSIPLPNTTPQKFPDLPGVGGGVVNPIALSLVWNTRDDVMRPTRGWRLLLKALHTDKTLCSDYEFTRFLADAGYLRAFNSGRQIVGLRINGEWIEAPNDALPFWEMSELGGADTLRGFFPHRFVGKGRVLINFELRSRLVEFDFFDLWHVRLDGVAFADSGRVYVGGGEIRDEFHLDSGIFDRLTADFQFSYGPGLRIVLSEALVARIDAGFSKEEKGLVFLAFGHTF
ncbi:MAG: BamA/TamA family outer membrane protein [Candidatus Binatia bacterium]